MKRLVFSIFTSLILISCQNKNEELTNIDINLLNGYWEIEQVIMADGSQKEFRINETNEFFEVKNDSGFRKKVTPQLDGTYLVNDVDEKITIEKAKNGTFIHYKTDYAKWKEQIKLLTKEQLILTNDQNIEYQYKHPTPFILK